MVSTTKPAVTFKINGNMAVLSGRHVLYHCGDVASFLLVHARDHYNDNDSNTLFIVDKHRLGIEVQVNLFDYVARCTYM